MRHWLKQLRKEQGLTQEQVAANAFINRAYYTQIEKGVRNPSFEVARAIAETLGFNPSRFFMDELAIPIEVALKNAPIVIAHCDTDLRYTWMYNPHPDFDPKDVIGKRDDELDNNPGIIELMELKQSVIDDGITVRKNISFSLTDGVHIYNVFGEPLINEDGLIYGAVTASMDVTHF
jgi:transcriptional regulator with XRE-family HTH domain